MTKRTKKHPGGRPVSTGRGHDGERVNVRLSAAEARDVRAAAERDGQTVAAWVRDAAVKEARRA